MTCRRCAGSRSNTRCASPVRIRRWRSVRTSSSTCTATPRISIDARSAAPPRRARAGGGGVQRQRGPGRDRHRRPVRGAAERAGARRAQAQSASSTRPARWWGVNRGDTLHVGDDAQMDALGAARAPRAPAGCIAATSQRLIPATTAPGPAGEPGTGPAVRYAHRAGGLARSPTPSPPFPMPGRPPHDARRRLHRAASGAARPLHVVTAGALEAWRGAAGGDRAVA